MDEWKHFYSSIMQVFEVFELMIESFVYEIFVNFNAVRRGGFVKCVVG